MNNKGDMKQSILKISLIIIISLLVLAVSLFFRFRGLFWGEYLFLHPDERFLVWVVSNLESVKNIGDYFNTHVSSLNPHNRGHGFFVYGDFPIIFTRYIAEGFFDFVGWNEVTQAGRVLSSLFDIGSVIVVFFIGRKLFNNWVGLLAAAFSGMAVLQIQQSHFFTVDTFATFFTTLALYVVILISKQEFSDEDHLIDYADEDHLIDYPDDDGIEKNISKNKERIPHKKSLVLSILFGVLVGLASASKINTVTISLLLPIAFFIIWDSYPQVPSKKFELVLRDLTLGGFFALLSFRIFQPFAFEGPGFFGIQFNELWLNNMREVSAQSSGNVDFPPALQWARRSFFFSGKNISLWGLGLPLSIFTWLGMITMGWKIIRGEWKKFLLIWIWTVGYFLWQSSLGNSVMRYQLPIYPMFGLMAAWFINHLLTNKPNHGFWRIPLRVLGVSSLIISISGTFVWAYMFSSIYERPITRIEASRWIYENVPGPINLIIDYGDSNLTQKIISYPYNYSLTDQISYSTTFSIERNGELKEIFLPNVLIQENFDQLKLDLLVTIENLDTLEKYEGLSFDTSPTINQSPYAYTVIFDPAINLTADHNFRITIENKNIKGITLLGSATANESVWDDGLPLRTDGYDGYGGIYQRDLTFEMYWEDNADKLERFISTLNRSDYIFISSNRQWGTTTRVPERYPLTTQFYQSLLGCSYQEDLYKCYSEAKPGMFEGDLGFELIKVFESYPQIGNFRINDQYADEAFTVYDHPKVLIFKKIDQYDPVIVSKILGSVDLSKVIFFTPGNFPDYPVDLKLPARRLEVQRDGGTWSEIFDTSKWINQAPVLSVVLWYLVIMILGWVMYPITRLGFNGLFDKGYAFSKLFAMLLVSLLVWLGGSFGLSVTKPFISIVVIVVTTISLVIAFFTKSSIINEIKQNYSLFLILEGITLVLFFLFLSVRLGNPDLWHPAKGGEKPMDFSYLNAVIKSSTFPPYDPWYAGGYINYYYYGFVIVGIFIKWLGIVPSIAYNIVLPTLFSFVGIGAFSIVWNLVFKHKNHSDQIKLSIRKILSSRPFLAGIGGLFFTLILGNLGTIRMIWHGLQRIGSPNGIIEGAKLFERWLWTIQGIGKFIKGQNFPFYPGDWYWVPSRALPHEPITEFPFFTFLYADLHAHLIAMPITVMAIAWSLSTLLSKWDFSEKIPGWLSKLILLVVGGITIGALRPTNTWDFPTYYVLGLIVLIYTILRYGRGFRTAYHLSSISGKILEVFMLVIVFSLITFTSYKPFYDWYGQAYTQIELWRGNLSPFWSYFTHWGLFLFIIISWLLTETTSWMAETPLSRARKLLKYRFWIWLVIAIIITSTFLMLIKGIMISWLVFPMAVWCGILILRKEQSESKRFVLFIIGSALVLTLMVEIIVLKGDIGRMNTVFKFYLQAWILFAISSGAALIWSIPEIMREWSSFNKNVWQTVLIILIASTALYPITAGSEKIKDRMSVSASISLDGMEFMKTSTYFDEGINMTLAEDYQAIRWMQKNVVGSPVIVEANTVEYRWGNRYSIYTGLPGVVGWNWHQRQQRGVVPSNWITDRVDEVNNFYSTTDLFETKEFLKKYEISYIIVGQLEKAKYPIEGIGKFSQMDGLLWQSVYEVGNTSIYQVLEDQK